MSELHASMPNLYVVRKSGIHHKGVFAKQDIQKGTCVIEYTGEKIIKAESDRRAYKAIEAHKRNNNNGRVYIFELNKRYDIDGSVTYNTARFINHSCNPNCETENVRGKIWITAILDIRKGEEISYDYCYDLEDYQDHPCVCGSKNCMGYIVAEEHRGKLKRLLRAH
jgi:SET domain-containing protein